MSRAGSSTSAAGLPGPNEVPISAPVGLDPAAGTYPILGDPSLAAALRYPPYGRLVFEYDHNGNALGRDSRGVPTTLAGSLNGALAKPDMLLGP